MDVSEVARMIAALAVTLGLIGLATVAARRWGPIQGLRMRAPADRRLQIVESLVLDPNRRLVVVRFDGQERLLLLGEGRLLAGPGAKSEDVTRA